MNGAPAIWRAGRPAVRSRIRVSVSFATALTFLATSSCLPLAEASRPPLPTEDVRGARALDQQGVLAFEAGRYHDALLYFDAAYAHGGPPSERWNTAKCHLHLDEPAQAEAVLVEYLALPGLTSEDRREAAATLDAIRKKPSNLTVMSVPPGLAVTVDGHRVGVTPITSLVLPGEHLLVVDRPPDVRQERVLTAHYGRAILVEAHP